MSIHTAASSLKMLQDALHDSSCTVGKPNVSRLPGHQLVGGQMVGHCALEDIGQAIIQGASDTSGK